MKKTYILILYVLIWKCMFLTELTIVCLKCVTKNMLYVMNREFSSICVQNVLPYVCIFSSRPQFGAFTVYCIIWLRWSGDMHHELLQGMIAVVPVHQQDFFDSILLKAHFMKLSEEVKKLFGLKHTKKTCCSTTSNTNTHDRQQLILKIVIL